MIKNVLFDFGGVMVSKEWWWPVSLLEEKYSLGGWFIENKIDSLVLNFEKWLLSSNDFLSWLNSEIWDELANDLFDFWSDRSGVIYLQDMSKFIIYLQWKGYRCCLLSDTNDIHKKTNYESWFYDIFDDVILSCDIWISKKEDVITWTTKFFDYALDKLNINAVESIFIDDLQVNCDVANNAWIKTILAENPKQIIKDLGGILGLD